MFLAATSLGQTHIGAQRELYVLDTAVMFGAVPARVDSPVLERAKWFDTDDDYLVPELAHEQNFALDRSRILREIDESRARGVEPQPAILGPVTFLRLSKLTPGGPAHGSTLDLVDRLLLPYQELLAVLADHAPWVQIDEPWLVRQLDGYTREVYRRAYDRLTFSKRRPRLLLATYTGAPRRNLDLALSLGCEDVCQRSP